jgi:hypothetical protein
MVVVAEPEAPSHQVEAIDPAQRIGLGGESGCDPLSGRIDYAPAAFAERGARSSIRRLSGAIAPTEEELIAVERETIESLAKLDGVGSRGLEGRC